MTKLHKFDRSMIEWSGLFLLWSAAFGIAFTQWPLYSENQNTKYLIGLAAAGLGYLNQDWLANTIDPLPAFTGLVYFTYRFLHQNFFYLYHTLLLGLYLASLMIIADRVFHIGRTLVGRTLFGAFVIAFHSSLLPPFSNEVMGTSLGWIVQAGVANQYLLNPVLQPSTFGVLLIFSIALFLLDRPYWSAVSAALAAVFHSTYLPSAAVLILAYVILLWWQSREVTRPLLVGLVALVLVLPVLFYNYYYLGPSTAELWQSAQDQLVNFRIPHHSIPDIWIDQTTYIKIGIVLAALVVVSRSKLFPIMLLAFAVAVGLTWLQVQINWDTLAFIAPWRISVFLVPLATSMLGAFGISLIISMATRGMGRIASANVIEYTKWIGTGLAVIWILLLIGRGVQAMQDGFESRRNSDLATLWAFGQNTKQSGQVYLVPIHMAEFRLETGLPVVVTFKSHPYKDTEVLEWRARVDAVNDFYANISCDKVAEMANRFSVTHVVLETVQFFDGCPIIQNVHLDDRYGVFEVMATK